MFVAQEAIQPFSSASTLLWQIDLRILPHLVILLRTVAVIKDVKSLCDVFGGAVGEGGAASNGGDDAVMLNPTCVGWLRSGNGVVLFDFEFVLISILAVILYFISIFKFNSIKWKVSL